MAKDHLLFTLSSIPEMKKPEKILLAEVLPSKANPETLGRSDVEAVLNRRYSGEWTPGLWAEEGRRMMDFCRSSLIGWTVYTSENYPPQLREIYDPPVILFYRGALPDYSRPLLGVVGTRYPTGRGRNEAFRAGLSAGFQGVGVVSGLARGVDLAAHQGNLRGGGRTVAVLGGGLDRIYPRMNADTARSILLNGGCLVSEYPPGVRPARYHYPERNRIISGLSRSVAVMEAPAQSGALITADFAAEQGRDLYIHELNLNSPCGEGGRRLAADGAAVFLRVEEVLVEWWGNSLSYGTESIFDKEKNTGKRTALLMEKELAGEMVRYQSEYFRRIK